jgi:hypothetical protein
LDAERLPSHRRKELRRYAPGRQLDLETDPQIYVEQSITLPRP